MRFTAAAVYLLGGCAAATPLTMAPNQADCAVQTSTVYGIDTSVADQGQWLNSITSKYYTDGNTWSGAQIPVFTTTYSQDGTAALTALGFVASDILEADGYQVVSSVTTVTDCTAPPSTSGGPSESEMESECTAHEDHWHCPKGIEEPQHAPGESNETEAEAEAECEAHQDHWHCPDGVKEPTYATSTTSTSASEESNVQSSGELISFPDLWNSLLVLAAMALCRVNLLD